MQIKFPHITARIGDTLNLAPGGGTVEVEEDHLAYLERPFHEAIAVIY